MIPHHDFEGKQQQKNIHPQGYQKKLHAWGKIIFPLMLILRKTKL